MFLSVYWHVPDILFSTMVSAAMLQVVVCLLPESSLQIPLLNFAPFWCCLARISRIVTLHCVPVPTVIVQALLPTYRKFVYGHLHKNLHDSSIFSGVMRGWEPRPGSFLTGKALCGKKWACGGDGEKTLVVISMFIGCFYALAKYDAAATGPSREGFPRPAYTISFMQGDWRVKILPNMLVQRVLWMLFVLYTYVFHSHFVNIFASS